MPELLGTALVTGASRGIGLAIAEQLAAAGMHVWLAARDAERLVLAAGAIGTRARIHAGDLTIDADRRRLVEAVEADGRGLDVLVLNAGTIHLGPTQDAALEDLEEQLASNVVAPYALLQACLPLLVRSEGQVLVVNSSAGRSANPGVGQFSATQHAMRALADSFRAEVNDLGVRVTVLHPGRTATDRQARVHATEGRPYRPELLMQPQDVAIMALAALQVPRTAEVTEIAMRPMRKG